jgi:hypothetical protein
MKLEPDPVITEQGLIFTLKRLFRLIAQAVNGKAEQTDFDALKARVDALENP